MGGSDTLQGVSYYLSEAAFTLYRITFDPIQKGSFPSRVPVLFGAVQVQNCPSFLAGTNYLIAGTKLYRITLSSVNAWLIRNTFVLDQKVFWYSVKAA